ncbi:hypothetical protein LCGC14_1944520 [marine sediment metagenome]|uniref:Uncharacterized protein n=1 Tax=marine sediment metagenome TaxID=412755 RepID=A0A0F9G7R0_9ZZZZ
MAYIIAAIAIFTTIGFGIFIFGNSKHNEGLTDGFARGRQEVINAILINLANEGNIVIQQGDQSVTLVVEGSSEPVIEPSRSK